MIDNAQGLDEILSQLMKDAITNRRADDPPQGRKMLLNEAKQALTTLIAKEIAEAIGLNDGQQLSPRTMKPYKNQRNRDAKVRDSLRVEQRQRAKERGLS